WLMQALPLLWRKMRCSCL
ncbi:general secretion pathway E domain protein, partial [Chlamydia psittaci C1/97]